MLQNDQHDIVRERGFLVLLWVMRKRSKKSNKRRRRKLWTRQNLGKVGRDHRQN